MTFESNYKFLQNLTRMFRLDDNAKTVQDQQRTASVANNSNHELDDDKKYTLCASMISGIVKIANDRVNGNQRQELLRLLTKLMR